MAKLGVLELELRPTDELVELLRALNDLSPQVEERLKASAVIVENVEKRCAALEARLKELEKRDRERRAADDAARYGF